jgi:uncharacterized cupredoxin-like copper-binding protein
MRGMLLTVGLLLAASGIAICVAYAFPTSSGPAGDVQASTVEYSVRLPSTLTAGVHTVGYTNDGTLAHEIVMFRTDLPANQLPLEANGDVNEDSPLLTNVADSGDELAPGGTKTFKTAALSPGHYVAICNLPGHYRLGMKLNVTVR